MSPTARRFLGWEGPLAVRVAEELSRRVPPRERPPTLVVVPTQEAGRRLRLALAEASTGQAVAAPRVLTPEALLSWLDRTGPEPAGEFQRLATWVAAITAAGPSALWPAGPPDAERALAHARVIERVREALGAAGWTVATAAARLGPEHAEAERWAALAALEADWASRLGRTGRADPEARRIELARAAGPPAGIERIFVAGTPDPLPLAVECLARWSGHLPVEVWIQAGAEDDDGFDDWGRPRPGFWSRRHLPWPGVDLQVVAEPSDAAAAVAGQAVEVRDRPEVLAVGVADPSLGPGIEAALAGANVPGRDLQGRPVAQTGWWRLAAAVTRLAWDDSADAVEAALLLRRPRSPAAGPSWTEVRAGWDALRAEHLPTDLTEARAAAAGASGGPADRALAAALDDLAHERRRLQAGAGAVAAWREVWASWWDAVPGDPSDPAGALARTVSPALAELEAVDQSSTLTPAFAWSLIENWAARARVAPRDAGRAVELIGWLELPWCPSPWVTVAGLHEGVVPAVVTSDAWLPEGVRAGLGLRTNEERRAGDAHLFEAVVRSRPAGGGVSVVVCRRSSEGEPLRPSRLIFQVPDEALPGAVEHAFREPPPSPGAGTWTRSWTLRLPPPPRPLTRLRVTDFRAYLACPLRFAISRLSRAERYEPGAVELSVPAFGTLLHRAWELVLGREEGRAELEADRLAALLVAALDETLLARRPRPWPLALELQRDAAAMRLHRAAAVEAEQRAQGWRTEQVEVPLRELAALEIGGWAVEGRIDRVDHNPRTGAWRLLDFKSSDRPVSAEQAHLGPLRRDRRPAPPYAISRHRSGRAWADLQLPLYATAWSRAGRPPAVVGYFNLPAAVAQTEVTTWDDLDPALLSEAWECAAGVVAELQSGVLGSPAEPSRETRLDGLVVRGTAATFGLAPAPEAPAIEDGGETGEGEG